MPHPTHLSSHESSPCSSGSRQARGAEAMQEPRASWAAATSPGQVLPRPEGPNSADNTSGACSVSGGEGGDEHSTDRTVLQEEYGGGGRQDTRMHVQGNTAAPAIPYIPAP